MSKMNPIKTAKNITDSYYRYIMTRFPFGKTNPELQKRFENLLYSQLGKEKLIKGPILEITPPYTKGKSLKELSELFPEWLKLKEMLEKNTDYDINRALFKHQEKALIKSLNNNIVVASGTGSGKTESFLFPIFQYCLENPGKGVRAIMIYPLNALIEDQIERLDKYLKDTNITFGKYTGQTPHTKKDIDKNQEYSKNHIITREEMRQSPPNILITNYAMLEYILLRPGDSAITNERDEHSFKFIILDEAHTYTGAQGTEVAYLIKRLRNKVDRKAEGIRCIATSATLGNGNIDFAERLFGAKFPSNSLIIGEKEVISESFENNDITYDLNPDEILSWGFPDDSITMEDIKNRFKITKTKFENKKEEVYEILKDKKQIKDLIKILEEEPIPIYELSRKIFNNHERAENLLVNLVAWGDYAQNKSKLSLIPARYHMLVSAPKGLFCSLSSEGKINDLALSQNDIKEFCPFEISVCKTCGESYIIGLSYIENGKHKYKAVSESFFESKIKTEGTSDIILFFKKPQNPELIKICTVCGTIDDSCEHSKESIIDLYRYNPNFSELDKEDNNEEINEKGCINCGSGNKLENQLVSLTLPTNGATSILASVIYNESPEMSEDELNKNNDFFNDKYGRRNNDWTPIIEKGKKLIVFSDSRQDAAFFGPYLQVSHNQLLFNKMVYSILKKKNESLDFSELSTSISTYSQKLINEKQKIALFLKELRPSEEFQKEMIDRNDRKNRIYHSILSLIDRTGAFLSGLEGLGLGVAYFNLTNLEIDIADLNLNEHNIKALAQLLLFYCRQREAFDLYPDDLDLGDNKDAYYDSRYKIKILKREDDEKQSDNSIVRLISKKPNTFQYLVKKVLDNITKSDQTWEKVNELIAKLADELSLSGNELKKDSKGNSYTLNIEKIQLLAISENENLPEEVSGSMKKFKSCKRCGRISWIDIGMCNFSKCYGELQDFNKSFQSSNSNHYRNWVIGKELSELRAVEHTAQLNKLTSAKNYQDEFKKGRINVLSSSTTFEMGVDLGDLSVVFMRNVPPGVANYIQRAGRAGRRPGVSPFVLTYCRNLPHDQYFFNNYKSLVSGKVTSPAIVLENKKIALRHFNAVVLSEFFKNFPEIFNYTKSEYVKDPICKDLFEINESFESDKSASDHLCTTWLPQKWKYFKDIFVEIFKDPNIESSFFESLFDNYINFFSNNEKYGLQSIKKTYKESIDYYKDEKKRFNPNIQKEQYDFNYFDSLIKQTREEQLISHLSSRGFLPSYAFPTDVVPLKILSDEKTDGVDLNRELGRAISEYAPNAQIIANSRLYTSGALHKFPKQVFKTYHYFVCNGCKAFFVNQDREKVIFFKSKHELCSEKVQNQTIKAIYPQWGFAVTKDKKGENIRINTKRKAKVYVGELFINEEESANTTEEKEIQVFENLSINLKYLNGYNMYRINTNKYNICADCGMSLPIIKKGKKKSSHKTPYGYECKNSNEIIESNLLSIFDTDVVRLTFKNELILLPNNFSNTETEKNTFLLSLLYTILESVSRVMEIERKDIDGLYKLTDKQNIAELILIDSVSGGAGHVARLMGKGKEDSTDLMKRILLEAKKIADCKSCNENTACYSCLFHYSNQKSQHLLQRGMVFKWLSNFSFY